MEENETPSFGRWLLAATVLGSSMEFIDGTVVNIALPSLQHTLSATGTQVQWVVEAYALFLSALLLVGGAIGDRLGLRRTFSCGIALFVAASVWCGLAPTIGQLLIARSVQGIGGALLVPNSLALLSSGFRGPARGRAIGTWSGFASMMTACGPVLGGWLVQHGSWRWAFFLNVPIGLVAAGITFWKVPDNRGEIKSKPPDVPGALLATLGLSAIVFGLLSWGSGTTLAHACVAIGLGLLGILVLVERRVSAPMVPLALFRSMTFTGANLLTFLLYGALSVVLFYLPMNLIEAQGYSPTRAGTAMLPLVAMLFLLSRWAGGLVARVGSKLPLVLGPAIAAIGYLLFARTGLGGTYWTTYFPALLTLGLGMTISVAPLTTVVMAEAPAEQAGAASGVNNAISQTAALLGLALSAPLFFNQFARHLSSNLVQARVAAPIIQTVEAHTSQLAAIVTQDAGAHDAVNRAFVQGFELIAVLASIASALAALAAGMMIRGRDNSSKKS